jgi:hypothetical protein
VDIEIGRHVCLDFVEELAELGGAVPGIAFTDDMAGGNIECCKQRGRPVALVIMGSFGDLPRPHGKHRLAAIKRLYLRLFIDAQHDGMSGRCYIEANNIAHLVNKIGIGGEPFDFAQESLECAFTVGLKAKGAPDSLHRRDRQTARPGHSARTPVRGIRWQALQRFDDHGFDPGIINRARRTRTRLVTQAIKPVSQEAPTPLADRNRIMPNCAATSLLCKPDAQPSTIRARIAKACAVFRRFAKDSSSVRSAAVTSTIANRNLLIAHLLRRKWLSRTIESK